MSAIFPQCYVCDAASNEVAERNQYRIVKCKRCGLVFANDELESVGVDSVVDTDPAYLENAASLYSEQVEVARRIVPLRIKEYEAATGRKIDSILEVGCGTGAYGSTFLDLGLRYRAIEVDARTAEKARSVSGADIDTGNFLTYELGETFDVIFASQVFEHTTEPNRFLQCARRTLNEDGILHLDVPNHASLASAIRKLVSKKDYGFIQPPHHMVAYTPDSLSYALAANDFELLKVSQYRNDHPVWGQLMATTSLGAVAFYQISDLISRPSLLTAVARPLATR